MSDTEEEVEYLVEMGKASFKQIVRIPVVHINEDSNCLFSLNFYLFFFKF